MAFRVLKPIAADGKLIPTGTLVDASAWRNLRALINNRYLVEVAEQVVSAVPAVVQTSVEKQDAIKVPKIKATTKTKVVSK
jgi:NAD-dependent DNA ligase